MPAHKPIIAPPAPPVIRRAKKNKWCKLCAGRIAEGTHYRLVDPWTWVHTWHPSETAKVGR